jgi:fibronectin type 3 domain-containing protein
LDSIPPQAPQEVKGWIDTLGIVRINWKSNTEKDLKMYRIFKSNHPNTTFIQINNEELKKNEFIDTFNIRLLNKKMYYKVAAVDNHYNQSLYSSVLVLAKPDLIPPASPSWKKVESSTSSIYLQWQPSQSEDVAFHQIDRKAKSDLEWKMIKQFDTKRIVNEYIDPVEKGKIYEYAIVAKDSAGLTSSFENKIKIKSIDDKILPVVTTLKAISDSKNKKIKLTWSYPISVEKIKIYRAEKGKSLSIWKIISGDQTEIDDKHVYINASYDYAIQVIDYFGSESTISKRVNVKY